MPSKKWKAFKIHKHCMRGAKKVFRSANKCILNSLQKCLRISYVYVFWLLGRTLKTFFLYTVAQKRLFIIGSSVKPCIAHIIYRKLLLNSDLPVVVTYGDFLIVWLICFRLQLKKIALKLLATCCSLQK